MTFKFSDVDIVLVVFSLMRLKSHIESLFSIVSVDGIIFIVLIDSFHIVCQCIIEYFLVSVKLINNGYKQFETEYD